MNTTLSPLSQVNFNEIKRVIFISSIAGSMVTSSINLHVEPISFEDLKKIINLAKERGITIQNFVGHPTTVSLLNQMLSLNLQANRGEYQINHEDLLVMISLKQRPKVSGQEVNASTIEDLLIRVVIIS